MLNFPLAFRPVQPMSTTDSRLTPSASASNNPFRNRPLSPNPTGASTASSSSSENDAPEDPTRAARPSNGQTTTSPQSPPNSSTTDTGTPSLAIDTSVTASDPLSEELPPAYTPAPDIYQGETSVEFGPRRPFQRAPPPLTRPQQPQPGPWVTPQQTGWTGYPGQAYSHNTGSSHISSRPGLVPPPTHPRSALRTPATAMYPPPSVVPPPNATSDFARDFYTAGAAPVDSSVLGGSSEQYTAQNGSPSGSGTQPQYNPPPDLPPRPSGSGSTRGHSRSASNASGSRASATSADSIPDDGSPTKKPVPGHPLLNRGNILVYPKGYECSKCHNTGYKHYDPTHPCKKCWSKYGKEYSGAITYTPWSSTGTAHSDSGKVFQKSLPKFPPPHQPSTSYLTRPAYQPSTSRPSSTYLGPSTARVIPTPGGGVPMSPYLDPAQRNGYYQPPPPGPSGPIVPSYNPPPGAVVYQPGDPRLGGRLCWRCGGSGTTSLFFIDESTCGICNGVGRTFI